MYTSVDAATFSFYRHSCARFVPRSDRLVIISSLNPAVSRNTVHQMYPGTWNLWHYAFKYRTSSRPCLESRGFPNYCFLHCTKPRATGYVILCLCFIFRAVVAYSGDISHGLCLRTSSWSESYRDRITDPMIFVSGVSSRFSGV